MRMIMWMNVMPLGEHSADDVTNGLNVGGVSEVPTIQTRIRMSINLGIARRIMFGDNFGSLKSGFP